MIHDPVKKTVTTESGEVAVLSSPRVSIGLPVFNGERFIAETIESVLSQTYQDWDLVICDNASTDGTREICEAYLEKDSRIRYYRNEANLGGPRNYNRCFELARGEYLKWIAADDTIAPEYIELCVQALDANPDAVVAYSRAHSIDGDSRKLNECRWTVPIEEQSDPVMRFRRFRLRSAWGAFPLLYVFGVLRTEMLRSTRLHGIYINSDSCLVVEMLLRGCFVEVPADLMAFRHHPGSYSSYADSNAKRLQFFDPEGGLLSRLLGHKRLHLEYLRAILMAPLSLRQKLRLMAYNLVWALGRAGRDEAPEAESSLLPATTL